MTQIPVNNVHIMGYTGALQLLRFNLFLLKKAGILECMKIDAIETQIKQKIAMAPKMDAKVKLDFLEDGKLLIDASQSPPSVSREDGDADTVLMCKIETFEQIMNGTLNPTMAFMMGKLRVMGNMGLAMKLNAMLED